MDSLSSVAQSGLLNPLNTETVYLVRVASFADSATAESTAAALSQLGYRAFIVRPEQPGGPYQVTVGPFATVETARLVESDLERRLRFRDARIVADVATGPGQ